MQRNEIKAFRQRLVRAGFTDICIREELHYTRDSTWFVCCRSKDGEFFSRSSLSLEEIAYLPFSFINIYYFL